MYQGLDGDSPQPALRGAPTSNQESGLACVAALIYGPGWRKKLAEDTLCSYRTVLRWQRGGPPMWVWRFLKARAAAKKTS